MANERAHRFTALDGWRGICALLVALHHLNANGHFYTWPLVRNAWLFVDFFFVLSGFVIAYAYGERLRDGGDVRDFMLRRFARLWPLHVTILAAFVALELYRLAVTGSGFTGERSVFAIVTNLLLVQSLGVHKSLTWNTPAWSISTEFYTYLAFAGVCFIAPTRRSVVAFLLALVGLSVLVFFSRYGMRETFGFGFFRCVYGFFAGVLTFEAWKSLKTKIGGTIAEIATLVVVGILVTCAPNMRVFEYLAAPIFAFAVFIFAQQAGAISRVIESRFANALGRWSYSIYMVHMLIVACFFSLLDNFGRGWTTIDASGNEIVTMASAWIGDLIALVYLTTVVAFASFTYRFVEKPGRRIFADRLQGKFIGSSARAR
ncbi:MAG TPA: acyltransferase [Rhizomicrobium sp.]|nr:acyltransferase [Rhizomicrobium sp.]